MPNNNKIKNIDLDVAVEIIRDDLGYDAGQCINENMAMASFLYEMEVPCTFVFGEAVFIPFNNSYRIVHRDDFNGTEDDDIAPFHCWLDVAGKVLDIAIGSWTHNLPDVYRQEYVHGDYHNEFHLRKTFNIDIFNEVHMPNGSYSYRKFKSAQRIKDLKINNGDKYRSNMTMCEDLGLGDIFRGTAQQYAYQYREIMN